MNRRSLILLMIGLTFVAIAAGVYSFRPMLPRGQIVPSTNTVAISVEDRGYSVTVGESKPFTTSAATVGEAVAAWDEQHGTRTYLADRITPSVDTVLTPGLQIVIQRSALVSFSVAERPFVGRATGQTVGEALAENGLLPVGLDYVLPGENTALESALASGGVIHVTQVIESVETRRITLPFTTRIVTDNTLASRVRRVVQTGRHGLAQEHTAIRTENGVEVSRGIPYRVTIQPPIDLVIAVGSP